MPKIGTICLTYEGEHYHHHEIHYSQKTQFSIKGLSKEFLALTDFHTFGYETERELTDEVKAACLKYRELKTMSKLVILYKFSASPELCMNKVSEGNYEGMLKGISRKIAVISGFCDLATIAIDYHIAQLVDDGVKKIYYKVDRTNPKEMSRHAMSHTRTYQEMDYTEERAAFFESLVNAMKKMVVDASAFFGAEPEQAVKFIEAKQQLMIGERNG